MEELAQKISQIDGLMSFGIGDGFSQDQQPVKIIEIQHEFASFNDAFYERLCEIYPDNNHEYEDDGDFYISTFIVYEY